MFGSKPLFEALVVGRYKFLSKGIAILSIALVSLVSIACSDSDHDPNSSTTAAQQTNLNIVETAVDAGNFTTLVTALQAAQLDDDLATPGPFTVFAPTDDAFALLPSGTIDTLLDPANRATLVDILLYHVINGKVLENDASALNGTSAVMLNALNVRVDTVNGELLLNLNGNRQAKVTATNIDATNGVIHVIDVVLDPDDAVDNIVDTAVANGSFTTLVTALQAAELDDDLEGTGPFTVFAPTDAAFALLPAGTIPFLLDPANKTTLIDILTYHVFDGSVLSPAAIALDGQRVTMLNNGNLAINIDAGDIVLNRGGSRQAKVIINDVLSSNGVIHIIDAVLDPADSQ